MEALILAFLIASEEAKVKPSPFPSIQPETEEYCDYSEWTMIPPKGTRDTPKNQKELLEDSFDVKID